GGGRRGPAVTAWTPRDDLGEQLHRGGVVRATQRHGDLTGDEQDVDATAPGGQAARRPPQRPDGRRRIATRQEQQRRAEIAVLRGADLLEQRQHRRAL